MVGQAKGGSAEHEVVLVMKKKRRELWNRRGDQKPLGARRKSCFMLKSEHV